MSITPPRAERHPTTDTRHGQTRTDDYAWLRDDNWQQVMRDPNVLQADIRAYLEAENVYTDTILAPLEGDIEALFEEMKGRIKQDDSSVPLPDGPWAYYRRYRDGGEHPLFCRQPRDGGEEALMFDGDAEAKGQAYFKLAACEHSPDHRYLAHAADLNGSEIYTLKVRDLESGQDLQDAIEGVHGAVEWSNDSRTLFYTVLDDNHRPCAVRRHVLGTSADDDVEIYREPDPGFFVSISKTESRRFMMISAHDHQTSEVWVLDTYDPAGDWQLISARDPGHEYDVTDWNGAFLIRTNGDGAEDFKVVAAPYDVPSRENWTDLVAHEAGRLILGVQAFGSYWVRMERVDALPSLMITGLDGNIHAVAFDEDAYALGMGGSYEFETTSLRFSYSSMTTPEQTFDYDMATRVRTLLKEQEVPSGHKAENYVTRRIQVSAPDGETVPVSLLYRKETILDGNAPCLLYGYGAYGMSMPASFSTARLSLVDRGFVYAIAHIRGGMEKGYRWYKAGRAEQKTNTFTDFIAAGEALVAGGFTSKGRIAAHGGSAGGMLMGAVANMAPELFGAVAADVPFVDVLNTMLDDTLPLTPPEWPEWGNPIDDAEAFARIAAYSPYDNVSAQNYPHIYVTAGLTDPRVTYWEPAKWVARLRELKTDANTLCLKTNMDAGHGGAAGRFQRLKETAEIYAFVLSFLSVRV
ncbi:MAG: S9 family peptidase [Rhodospirillaceae bacterium]|nr:S9 family peptidase [Rhodospirillaceae bacterium]